MSGGPRPEDVADCEHGVAYDTCCDVCLGEAVRRDGLIAVFGFDGDTGVSVDDYIAFLEGRAADPFA